MNDNKYSVDKKFPPDSAGGLMIEDVPVTLCNFSIAEACKLFEQNLKSYESINYVYVVDGHHYLKGVLSLKNLLRLPSKVEISKVMITDLVTVHPYTDQEKVAYKALKSNIKSIPVIDKRGKFLGVVPSDVILEVTFKEAQEDLLGISGVSTKTIDDVMKLSIRKSLVHRLPWLITGIVGGLLSAKIISSFQSTLQSTIILIGFIPLVTYTASAVGSQMQAFLIRDVAVQSDFSFVNYLTKQLRIIFLMGLIIGLSLWLVIGLLYSNFEAASIIGIAMFISIISSLFSGLFVPFTFKKLNIDPANGSAPIGTIIQDLTSLTIYLFVASIII